MKKIVVYLCVLVFLCMGLVANAYEVDITNSSIILNGENQTFSVPTITYNDRTMVPMRELFEKLGASVEWVEDEQIIIAETETKTIIMQIDNNWTLCNDIDIYVDAAPILYNDRTMVPLRFVCEQLSLSVEWDGDNNTITLDSIENVTYGSVEYNDGFYVGNYTGELIDNIPNGVGCFLATGTIENPNCFAEESYSMEHNEENYIGYKGCFKDGYYDGWGKYATTLSSRARFWKQGIEQDGYGEFCLYNACREFGVYVGDEIENGYKVWAYGGWYEGGLKNGLENGNGKEFWANGNLRREGVFEEGYMYGYGKEYNEDGTLIYEGGHWKDVWTNTGTKYYGNGVVCYTGGYNDGNPHGHGVLYREDGSKVYEGNFVDGYFQGLGKQYYENGVLKYEGEFWKGGWEGFGKLYRPDGSLDYSGRFTYNETTGKSYWSY